MKIMIIMPLAEQRGGGEKRLWDLMLEGRNVGIEWLLIFLEDGLLVEQIRNLGIDTRVVLSGRLREPHRFIATAIGIAAIARSERANVILSWMWKAHLYGSPVASSIGIPSLWSQLDIPNDSLLQRIVRSLPTSGVFINSKSGKTKLNKHYPEQMIRLVYPGVALDQFNPSSLSSPLETRQNLGLPLDGPIIGIVSRLQRWKGIHTLIQSMPKVLQRYPNAHCIVVGGKHDREADYENYLREKIRELELENCVMLAGLQRNIPEWMQAMDIFVHASNNEPFGIVIVEAMALGKPVVASNSGGPMEIITDGVNGLLTSYEDVDGLANAIFRYLDNQDFTDKVKLAARERAYDFSTQRYVENFITALRELVPNV
ncbi:MAG TPA: glycosyl transferase family 1 [Cyanobacteria bacterium UBA11149]|nr:glycosyl transferase family 1 [Cyanobacteria bacterium UBA11367]HBE56167.1 glycosyl transferase family 1 [Cyanobacteria bacterium UBA11366]HBK62188.1 glycosyl transferase family 1 [Cyanobacteria bacterium UBA11166]HBR73903.1 glycosyl transferase family 1 [Cyanobacteria bacterium UBA11159]HBS70212.1 glycosyl transferase family 1 [Cyanobacteria bacterium UBA11153]HBW90845.1 glycosyl transferase family 1 [Cyanobacteria bacterium UBA11149]HCA96339.1 glycosyl transferase family 1 [Cyanobacteria